MAQRRKVDDLKAMAKPNARVGIDGLSSVQDPRTYPKTRRPNPTGEARIGPPTQGDINAESLSNMSGLLNVAGITPVLGEAGEVTSRFAKMLEGRYPRIASMVNTLTETPMVSKSGHEALGATSSLPLNKMPDRTNNPVELRKYLRSSDVRVSPAQSIPDKADTLAHEFTHVADTARDPQFVSKYNHLLEHVPYELMPQELKANRVAAKLGPQMVEADRLGTTLKAQKMARGEVTRFNRRPVPGSMAEFAPTDILPESPNFTPKGDTSLDELLRKLGGKGE